MKNKSLFALFTVFFVFFICGSVAASGKAASETKETQNKNLSILWSAGGNGEFINYTVDKLRADYGLNIDLEYNTKAHEVLRPQIIAGNPPDITMVQHGMFDYFEAIQQGAFAPIDDYLNLNVDGGNRKIKEIIGEDLINIMRVNGKSYIILSNVNVSGLYYNKTMFDKYGWKEPKTWDEFIALCRRIKAEAPGVEPLIYPGKYPYYLDYFFTPNILSLGKGLETLKAMNNMEKGIWSSPAVLGAAKRMQQLRDEGLFARGLISLSHTESQMEFINGRAAMICNGSWLYNEMAGNWPDDFELTYIASPTGLNASDPQYVRFAGNLFGFPSVAKNKDYNDKFLQIYYSEKSATRVAADYETVISSTVIAYPSVSSSLSKPVVQTFNAADKCTQYFSLYNMWYASFYTEFQNLLTALVSGQINAEDFCQRLEQEAEKIRQDSSIKKYTAG
jgi:N-acetylglucosamine transport system substrate-binding protein